MIAAFEPRAGPHRPARGRRGRRPRPAPASRRGGRAPLHRRGGARRGDPVARRARRARDRRRRRVRAGARRAAAARTSTPPYETLASSRPTAVNLRWALDEMRADPTPERARAHPRGRGRALRRDGRPRRRARAAGGAHPDPLQRGRARDRRVRLGRRRDSRGRGAGRSVDTCWVDETRPLLQGARLTAWELEAVGIPHAVIVDSAAASLMAAGEVDIVDHRRRPHRGERRHAPTRSARTASRCSPRHHEIPFVIVAPSSTIDPATPTGAEIPIEERDGAEVTPRFPARNPAFDVTPAGLIAAIVTEEGIHRAPYAESLPSAGDRVKAIILAAGYATRLRPLTTRSEAAAAGRRPPDARLDPRQDRGSRDRRGSTSSRTRRFAADFERWAAGKTSSVHDDGTTTNETRLGAIGNVQFVQRARRISTTTCS